MDKHGYEVWVVADGDTPYCDSDHDSLASAKAAVNAMAEATYDDGSMATTWVFDHRDDILILDPSGAVVSAWNRDETRNLEDYADFKRNPSVIGYQVVTASGEHVQGDARDPFGLTSFAILQGRAVETARNWIESNPGFGLSPVRPGEIEEPEFVRHLELPRSAPTPAG